MMFQVRGEWLLTARFGDWQGIHFTRKSVNNNCDWQLLSSFPLQPLGVSIRLHVQPVAAELAFL